jgi:hypothetical protein
VIANGQKTLKAHALEGEKTVAWEFIAAQCIEADDPRLKGK